jgi:hypothetical protein
VAKIWHTARPHGPQGMPMRPIQQQYNTVYTIQPTIQHNHNNEINGNTANTTNGRNNTYEHTNGGDTGRCFALTSSPDSLSSPHFHSSSSPIAISLPADSRDSSTGSSSSRRQQRETATALFYAFVVRWFLSRTDTLVLPGPFHEGTASSSASISINQHGPQHQHPASASVSETVHHLPPCYNMSQSLPPHGPRCFTHSAYRCKVVLV